MCSRRTSRTRTGRRVCSCPADFAKFASYPGSCPHPGALSTDRSSEIAPRTAPCPAPSRESRMRAAEDRLPAVPAIPSLF